MEILRKRKFLKYLRLCIHIILVTERKIYTLNMFKISKNALDWDDLTNRDCKTQVGTLIRHVFVGFFLYMIARIFSQYLVKFFSSTRIVYLIYGIIEQKIHNFGELAEVEYNFIV